MVMMYIFICTDCGRIRMVSENRTAECNVCRTKMAVCDKSFVEWTNFSIDQRNEIIKEYIEKAKYNNVDRIRPKIKNYSYEFGYDY